MYAVIYGTTKISNVRVSTAIIKDVKAKLEERVYDLDSHDLRGAVSTDITDAIIYTLYDNENNIINSGFIKNLTLEDDICKFKGEDLKKIFDTDVLLDFSNGVQDLTLSNIFQKTCDAVSLDNDYNINLNFQIDEDLTDTKAIADYTGEYIIVNALKFLKVYLAYYGYYMSVSYIPTNDTINIGFYKNKQKIDIKLIDFSHERTLNDIKVNRTIATISFDTKSDEQSHLWEVSTEGYYDSIINNKGIVIGDELPRAEDYAFDYALKLLKNAAFVQATENDFNQANIKRYISIDAIGTQIAGNWVIYQDPNGLLYKTTPIPPGDPGALCYTKNNYAIVPDDGGPYIPEYWICEGFVPKQCTLDMPSLQDSIKSIRKNPEEYTFGTVFRIGYTDGVQDCGVYNYVKITYDAPKYYKKIGTYNVARPNLPKKTYSLGKDNQIYEGYAPDDKKLYPIVTKLFESQFLADAQFNAIYQLINNRWVENIIIDNTKAPLSLENYQFLTMITVYDKDGYFKELPITEKLSTLEDNHKITKTKLGFKKTSFIEIIKNDVKESETITKGVKSINKGTTVFQSLPEISDVQPVDAANRVWIKTIGE